MSLPQISYEELAHTSTVSCPPIVPPGVFAHVSGDAMVDTSLLIKELVWVGPECRGVYVGTPSIDSNNDMLLATHDFFGATTYDDTVQVYTSTNGGLSWEFLSNVTGIYWANIFFHGEAVYMMGVAGDDIHKVSPPNKLPMKGGPVVITTSSDGGHTWTSPQVLLHGSFQTASTPIVQNNGKEAIEIRYLSIKISPQYCGAA